jgi:uncharacterized membrane protein YjjP (DUF1212 family)
MGKHYNVNIAVFCLLIIPLLQQANLAILISGIMSLIAGVIVTYLYVKDNDIVNKIFAILYIILGILLVVVGLLR